LASRFQSARIQHLTDALFLLRQRDACNRMRKSCTANSTPGRSATPIPTAIQVLIEQALRGGAVNLIHPS